MDITPYIEVMKAQKAESLFLYSNRIPEMNIQGKKREVGSTTLTREMLQTVFDSTTNDAQKSQFTIMPSLRYTAIIGDDSFHIHAHEKNNNLIITFTSQLSAPAKKVSAPSKPTFNIYSYLSKVVELEGSDLFIAAGSVISARIEGEIIDLDKVILSPEITHSIASSLMTEMQFTEFEEAKEYDFAISMPDDSARFRINAFYQRQTISLVMRLIPNTIPTAED